MQLQEHYFNLHVRPLVWVTFELKDTWACLRSHNNFLTTPNNISHVHYLSSLSHVSYNHRVIMQKTFGSGKTVQFSSAFMFNHDNKPISYLTLTSLLYWARSGQSFMKGVLVCLWSGPLEIGFIDTSLASPLICPDALCIFLCKVTSLLSQFFR